MASSTAISFCANVSNISLPVRQQGTSSSRRSHLVSCTSKQTDGNVADKNQADSSVQQTSRRELILQSSTAAVLASLFHFSGEKPKYLGVNRSPPSLALCPATPNCISTSEEINDPGHYVPPWTYNPQDGRGRKNPATREQAMSELLKVIQETKPDGFSPLMGYVDDVEFWFPPGDRSLVEYRSASRLGESDLDINRKRIKALRLELQNYGWESVGF